MALSESKKKEYMKRLMMSRLRILCNHGFYGLLLMHMIYTIDENCETASTDGVRIYFGPKFLDNLNDSELDFVMMHEILHVALRHCSRGGQRDSELFNIACDIVVNSNILKSRNMDKSAITLRKYGESMHLTPSGKEGYEYTAEQVYAMLPTPVFKPVSLKGDGEQTDGKGSGNVQADGSWDDHSYWGLMDDDDSLSDLWKKRFEEACEAISIRDPSNGRGLLPKAAERLFKELKKPQTDWRTILNDFIQEDVVDYSFTPPDRRFDDSPFFLPDFNEKDDIVEDILFMIDTSASMSDDMITAAYSEIKGAIDQFDGKLKGWLGFFDAAVVEPQPFSNEDEFKVIKAAGGGGTSFHVIFHYVSQRMQENPPASIVILTDGYAPFPPEDQTEGIPVLWLLNNEEVNPPWGKVARIEV